MINSNIGKLKKINTMNLETLDKIAERNPQILGPEVVIFCGVSGAGKSTYVELLKEKGKRYHFSVSDTTRKKRDYEKIGVHYNYPSVKEFKENILLNKYLEWEEVYKDCFYGSPVKELERARKKQKQLLFDIDVKGAFKLKKMFGKNAFLILVETSLDTAMKRLHDRKTESTVDIEKRINRYNEETEIVKSNRKYIDFRLNNKEGRDIEEAYEEVFTVIEFQYVV
jgi:guanylate kinase